MTLNNINSKISAIFPKNCIDNILGLFRNDYSDVYEKLIENLSSLQAMKDRILIDIINEDVIQIVTNEILFVTDKVFDILANLGIANADYKHTNIDLDGKRYLIGHIYLKYKLKSTKDVKLKIKNKLEQLLESKSEYDKACILINKYIDNTKDIADQGTVSFLSDIPNNFIVFSSLENKINKKSEQIFSISKICQNSEYLDCIKIYHNDFELSIIGLFKPTFFNYGDNMFYPIFADKIKQMMRLSNYDSNSYSYRSLSRLMQYFPKYELISTDNSILFKVLQNFIQNPFNSGIYLHHRIYENFTHGVIFIHRDNISRGNIALIRNSLKQNLDSIVYQSLIDNNQRWCQYYFISYSEGCSKIRQNIDKFYQHISKNIVSWNSAVYDATSNTNLKLTYNEILDMYPSNYRNDSFARDCIIQDTRNIDNLVTNNKKIVVDIDNSDNLTIKIYSKNDLFTSHISNIINSIGFNIKYIHRFHLEDVFNLHLYNITVEASDDLVAKLMNNTKIFLEDLPKIIENNLISNINKLMIYGVNLAEIQIMSALASYLRQIANISLDIIYDIITTNAKISKRIIKAFECKFNLDNSFDDSIISQISIDISKITKSNDVKILSYIIDVVNAITRANVNQRLNNNQKPYIAFKVNTGSITWAPKPVPYAEIFVYNNDFEGCHLRNKPVSRGGFRWSDRIDYRTEVLGLIKAQIPKNSIIVPSGAKACFYIKKSAHNCNNYKDFVKECYKNFVRGILDLTDNIIAGNVIHPENTKIYDYKDPYIVAAADKGTATFSDTANSISAEYKFWLGDAFASGGSHGYDHKKMGITSRGAYVSAKQSFYELGIDVESSEVSAIGIGDMSGDVFGNGMLLFKKLKLIAAFNHIHIFIDPNPNIEASLAERTRLFNNPELKWSDYDRKIISQGGGIFERFGSKIEINTQIRNSLDIPNDITEIEPEKIIPYILKARVDMIWNGGIGTFMKSSLETNTDVQDKFNDPIRINGNELRAKVFVEGGNVGVTQKGRIEASRNNVKINMDAIDNSGGVDCSDHEVNIKIVFNGLGKFDDERNKILADMQSEVASLVLRDNYLQTKVLGVSEAYITEDMKFYANLVKTISDAKVLDVKLENIPSYQEMLDIVKLDEVLTRPHLCTLLSHTKIYLHDEIIDNKIVEDLALEGDLFLYFPLEMQKRYKNELKNHPLRKNIIATSVVNEMVNFCGILYAQKIINALDISIEKLVKLYIIIREVFEIKSMFDLLHSQDYILPSEQQISAIRKLQNAIFFASLMIYEHVDFSKDLEQNISAIKLDVDKFYTILKGSCCTDSKQSCCFDADYTAKFKIIKASSIIFETIEVCKQNKTSMESVYKIIQKIYANTTVKKLQGIVHNSMNIGDIDEITFCLTKLSHLVCKIILNDIDVVLVNDKLNNILEQTVDFKTSVLTNVSKCALMLAKLS